VPAVVKLLAVAALVAGAAGGALWAGAQLLQPDADDPGGIAQLCADVDEYGPPGSELPDPTAAPWPEIGPAARLSAGVLEPGDYAILGDGNGPGALLRISDPRLCERYPTARPEFPGDTFAVVRMEMLVLRDGFMAPWLGGEDELMLRRGLDPFPTGQAERVFGVPGINHRSTLTTRAGYEAVSDLVFPVGGGPEDDLFVEYRTLVDGQDNRDQPAVVSWRIGRQPARERVTANQYWPGFDLADLSVPPASGRIDPGEWARVDAGGTRYAVRAGDVDQVERYPGAVPGRGAFVEVRISSASDGSPSLDGTFGPHEWRAVDGAGGELTTLQGQAEGQAGVLGPLFTSGSGGGWLVIDASPEGEIVLEYRHNGEGPVLFEVQVRPALAP
jgi:hypothetical protein